MTPHMTATLDSLNRFDTLIDVRSPAEFAEDHIPGAINCPVLDDAQRAQVGTLYKQVSPFEARKVGAALVSENIARHLRAQFMDRPKTWRPLIYCWRGGQRSGAMTIVLRQVGWGAQQLEGGYKAYRRHVLSTLETLPAELHYQVIGGATGSGKSRILHALADRGAQVLDLEHLAAHKGSVLGVLPGTEQPSQKTFDSLLLQRLQEFDPARPVYVEAESRKVGNLHLPDTLLACMRRSPCITVAAPMPARVAFLLRDYDYFIQDTDWLIRRLDTLRNLRGNDIVNHWITLARQGSWEHFVHELLEKHYDPLYHRSQTTNYAAYTSPLEVHAKDLSTSDIGRLADAILGAAPPCPATPSQPGP